MEPRTLGYCAGAADGRLLGGRPAALVLGLATDSRSVSRQELFVALRGEKFDGHLFLDDVAARGAAGAIVEARAGIRRADLPLIEVDDARAAFARLAGAYRREFQPTVVAVGGSNGKTSVKELVACVLAASRRIVKSPASYNNDVGVPGSLLLLHPSIEAAVFEVGSNHPGELSPLARLIAPQIGVITSIGREHLEHFGSLAGVAAEEGALAEALPAAAEGGILILPDNAPFAADIAARTSARVVRFGFSNRAQWRGRVTSLDWEGVEFEVEAPWPGWSGPWRVPIPARHMAANALAALAAAAAAGADPGPARAALAGFRGAPRRLELHTVGDIRLIDDTYNANADSLLAALQTLAELPCPGRRVAVIGDMAELGPHTDDAHREAGRHAARLGISAVWCVGRSADITAEAAGPATGRVFADINELVEELAGWLRPGDAALLKASRSSRLDRAADGLLDALRARQSRPAAGMAPRLLAAA